MLVAARIHAADINGRDGAAPALASVRRADRQMRHVFADDTRARSHA